MAGVYILPTCFSVSIIMISKWDMKPADLIILISENYNMFMSSNEIKILALQVYTWTKVILENLLYKLIMFSISRNDEL